MIYTMQAMPELWFIPLALAAVLCAVVLIFMDRTIVEEYWHEADPISLGREVRKEWEEAVASNSWRTWDTPPNGRYHPSESKGWED